MKMLAIKGKKVNTITKGIIKNGIILIENGKIKKVGSDVKIPRGIKTLKAKYVMPGLVEAHCLIGIWEESVGWQEVMVMNELNQQPHI